MFLKYLDLQDVYTTKVFEWDKFMNPIVHMPWEMFTGYSRTFRGCCFLFSYSFKCKLQQSRMCPAKKSYSTLVQSRLR